jgi:hypothetical protein
MIIVSSSIFTLGHNLVIQQYDCNKIKDQILLLDCKNASIPISFTQLGSVGLIGVVLIIIGLTLKKKPVNISSKLSTENKE